MKLAAGHGETREDGVTVVVPFHNRSRFALRLFQSVIAQTLRPVAVYIVDNGSSPHEAAECRRIAASLDWSGIRAEFLESARKGNANVARNLGMKAAGTRYVAFLDSDDWWDPPHLERSVDRLRGSRRAAVYSGATIHRDGVRVKASADVDTFANPFDLLISDHIAQTSSYVVDMERLGSAIAWDERLRRHQDYDFFLRVQFEGAGWAFLPTPFVHIDWERGGAAKVDFRSMIRFRQKWERFIPRESWRRYAYLQMLGCRDTAAHPMYERYYTRLYLRASKGKWLARVHCLRTYRAVKDLVHRLKSGPT